MRALDLDRHMRKLGTWVNWAGTVDTFKAGDPDAEVRGIAVAWQSQWPALRKALELGCNLFVTHEPTYYVHRDDVFDYFYDDALEAKRAWLKETGMVVYRCHDVWDIVPSMGVRDSWAKGLGLKDPPLAEDERRYLGLYRVDPQPLRRLAARLLDRVRELGQQHIQLVGDGGREVRGLAIGTGAACRAPQMAALRAPDGSGPDALLVTEDGVRFWGEGEWVIDRDIPMLVVNHATAEEWGMRSLAGYLKEQFPEVPVHHIRQGCMYQTLTEAAAG